MSDINEAQEKKAIKLRDELAEDFDEKKANEFASVNENQSWYGDFKILLDMLTTPSYKLSNKTKLTIAGTLAYVILPIDVIPDFLPIVGWLDDAFVLGLTINSLKEEIANFKKFKDSL